MAKRGVCPVCNREMNLKADGTVRHHSGQGRDVFGNRSYRCEGAGQQPSEVVDEPACTHRSTEGVGVVCWPEEYEPGKAHASTCVCHRAACQEDAVSWVERQTGHPGMFKPFRKSA